ncbi:hypothetical protein ACROYT_G008419 [Oculina patagonica]
MELVRALKAQLEEKKPTLEDAQGLCEKLTDQNKDEPLIVAAIKDKLDKVESPYEDLKAKITELEGSDDEELQETIRHQEPVFDQLMKNGNNLLESAEPGAEKEELEAKLADIEKRWNNIKENTSEHLARVNSALPEAEKYNESASSLVPWLTETEEKLAFTRTCRG